MANERDPRYGVTDVMSMDPPDDKDRRLDAALMAELKTQNEFESPEDTEKRRSVLARLEQVLRRLVQMMGKEKRLPQAILDAAGGKVYTYGSFELGVYGPGSDIDTLMLAPKHVSRDHFFSHIEDLLRGEFRPVEITELTPVPGIAVPIVKLEVCGVSVDLIFCSLQVSSVTTAAIDMTDVSVLRGLNEVDRRCVNGTRVTRRILELVPETKTFRTTLRAVKLWAKRRALYGNIVGFPGGVAWALMVARVCQLYPRASASKLLLKFFQIMLSWRWPTPVKLCPDEPAPFELMQWDPQLNYGDRRHLMPVITPCFPTANAIHTVGPSTKRIIVREWRRAAGLVARIHDDAPRTPWRELFQRHDFFVRAYKHYITVVTAGKTRDASQAWAGLVESKVKHLVRGIEMSEATSIDLVHPFNKGFRRVHRCRGPNEQDRVCDGSMAHQVHDASSVEEASPTPDAANGTTPPSPAAAPNGSSATDPGHTPPTPADTVWTVTFYLGIDLRPGSNALDMSEPVAVFKAQCIAWPGYDDQLHSIRIKHVRNYDLPNDVFAPGEAKPIRTKKKKAPTSTPTPGQQPVEAVDKKRSLADAGLDDPQYPSKQRPSAPRPNGVAG